MSEPNTNTEPTVQPTAQPVNNTQSTAANVDINQIVELAAQKASETAAKKETAVFKSMLEQHGMEPDIIRALVDDYKSKIVTPEQTIADKEAEINRIKSELESTKRERVALGKNIPEDKINKYLKLAEVYIADDVDLNLALDRAIEEFPIEKPNSAVNFSAKTENQTNTNESLVNAMRKGRGKANQRPLFTFKE